MKTGILIIWLTKIIQLRRRSSMTRAYNDTRSFRSIGLRGKSVFQCSCCKRQTRMSTQDSDEFCAECYDLVTLQNSLWDDGVEIFITWGIRPRDELIAKIGKRKGDVEAVKRYVKDLFAVMEPV